jgi:hypothetical protein
MCAKWLEKGGCHEIIASIEAARNKHKAVVTPSQKGSTAPFYKSLYEDIAGLLSYIVFKDDFPECEKAGLVREAIFTLGGHNAIEAKPLLAEISKAENIFLRKTPTDYRLVTSLSITCPRKARALTVQGNRVRFYAAYPKRYSRENLSQSARRSLLADEPTNYTWVVVSVKARSVAEAASKGLGTLDLLRGIWNLAINSEKISRHSMGGRPKPVNDILLGPLHSVHDKGGAIANEHLWWYQPDYVEPLKLYDINKQWDKIQGVRRQILRRLQNSPFARLIEDTLIRYTNAMDETKLQTAFLHLWALLEALTATQNASYKDTVTRASFFYSDREHAMQILNHLRERRNRAIHQGTHIEDSEVIVYQMKTFCERILWFLLFHSRKLNSVEEYRQFLDSSCDTAVIDRNMRIMKAAKDFLGGK